MTTLINTAAKLGVILALIGTALFVSEAGIQDTWDIMAGNTDDVSVNTTAIFGTEIDFVDRVTVTTMVITFASALGLVAVSRSNPRVVNDVLRYAPILGLAIGITAFSDQVMDVMSNDWIFDDHGDGYNGMILAVTGWVMMGIASLIDQRK